MRVENLSLLGLKRIVPKVFEDERGVFFESYHKKALLEAGIATDFVQDNFSFSQKNVIRGLHFQRDPGQEKLVACVSGMIWDVAVDLREDSPTFGRWEALCLSEENRFQLYIPKGFAHGFCVLSETAKVHYKVGSFYDPLEERSIRWNDPDIAIVWPIEHPILSKKDRSSPFFKEVCHVLDHRR